MSQSKEIHPHVRVKITLTINFHGEIISSSPYGQQMTDHNYTKIEVDHSLSFTAQVMGTLGANDSVSCLLAAWCPNGDSSEQVSGDLCSKGDICNGVCFSVFVGSLNARQQLWCPCEIMTELLEILRSML